MRRKARLVLHDEEPFEGVEVEGDGTFLYRAIGTGDISGQRRHGNIRCDVACQGLHQPEHLVGIVVHPGGALDIGAPDFVDVVADVPHGAVGRGVQGGGPSAAADGFDDVGQCKAWFGRRDAPALEQVTERHFAGPAALFEQGHRVQAHACNPAGAGVSHKVVGRHCRASEDEPAHPGREVRRPPDVVPDVGDELPLVQQAGWGAANHELRVQRCGLAGDGVEIEEDLAPSGLACGRGLAARLGAFDQDRCRGAEAIPELGVGEPWPVRCSMGFHDCRNVRFRRL